MGIQKKKSFLEKLTGSVPLEEEDSFNEEPRNLANEEWAEEEIEEGQLTVDVYQTPNELVLKTMVAGVKPDDLQVTITRDMVTIRGKRVNEEKIVNDDFFFKELYWGTFTRTVLLPEEVDPDEAEAVEKHGLLTIRLPKVDKERTQRIKVKSG